MRFGIARRKESRSDSLSMQEPGSDHPQTPPSLVARLIPVLLWATALVAVFVLARTNLANVRTASSPIGHQARVQQATPTDLAPADITPVLVTVGSRPHPSMRPALQPRPLTPPESGTESNTESDAAAIAESALEPESGEPNGNEPNGNEPNGNEPNGNEPNGNEPGENTPEENEPVTPTIDQPASPLATPQAEPAQTEATPTAEDGDDPAETTSANIERPTPASASSTSAGFLLPTPTPTPAALAALALLPTPTSFPPEAPAESPTEAPPTSEPLPLPAIPETLANSDGEQRTARVPILMYHYISVPPPGADIYRQDLSVAPDRFAAHLDAMREAGYTPISLYDLLAHLTQGAPLPEKPVILTFDDGYRDNYENAFPLLRDRGVRATFFVVTDFIDQQLPAYLTWDMVREMHAAGMSIESHGRNHVSLENKDRDYLIWQALGSLETIQYELGVRPRFVSYPAGDYDALTIEVFRSANYWAGLTTVQGATHSSDDLFQLRRVRVRGTTSAEELLRLLALDW